MSEEQKKNPARLLITVALVILGFFLMLRFTSLGDYFTLTSIRNTVSTMGVWGMALFLALNIVGAILHVPGALFVVAAMLIYDTKTAVAISYAGAVLSTTGSFIFFRIIGGKSLHLLKSQFLHKILSKIHERPILTTIAIRSLGGLSPPINSTLALTSIKFRHYLAGSMIGLIGPVLLFCGLTYYLQDKLVDWVS